MVNIRLEPIVFVIGLLATAVIIPTGGALAFCIGWILHKWIVKKLIDQ